MEASTFEDQGICLLVAQFPVTPGKCKNKRSDRFTHPDYDVYPQAWRGGVFLPFHPNLIALPVFKNKSRLSIEKSCHPDLPASAF
jgi:hypothetical protein